MKNKVGDIINIKVHYSLTSKICKAKIIGFEGGKIIIKWIDDFYWYSDKKIDVLEDIKYVYQDDIYKGEIE